MATNDPLINRLDKWHAWARNCALLQRFTVFTRLLLGIGFIAPGLTKLLGNRFTTIPTSDPIGAFFEAMYQTGGYWRFIGAAQICAAVLTLIPRTATLGALMFFPIILNIFVITVALHFTGTPFITAAMLLANAYLLGWDYHKFKPILFNVHAVPRAFNAIAPLPVERFGYGLCVVSGLIFTLALRGVFPQASQWFFWAMLATGLLGGLLILCGWIWLALNSKRSLPAAMN
jgi:hypothetical protein